MANRVASAARNIPPSAWLHVPTAQNTADCASRGLSAEELKYHDLWWGGPPWLSQEPVSIPPQPQAAEIAAHQGAEAKPLAVYAISAEPHYGWEDKFNAYSMLLHTTAYVIRFCANLKAATQGQPLMKDRNLSVAEVEAAEVFLFKKSQARTYAAERKRLSAVDPLPMAKGSSLRLVHPFLQENGLLCVGGRLNKAALSSLQKHPVILSPSDVVTKLFFKHHHVMVSH